MGEGFFLSGLAANACVQAEAVTVTSEDANFPKDRLQDGKPWRRFKFGDLTADPTIEFDHNIIKNPSFEDDADGTSPPTGWKIPTGGGSPDVSTAVTPPDGTKSLRLNLASEAAYQDRIVRPAGTYRHSVGLRGDGTNIVSAYVLDLLTGKYWSGSAWATTKSAWATRSTATFDTSTTDFTLEAVPSGHIGPGRVRVLFDRPGTIAGAAYVDQVYLYPKITVAALAFHTIPIGFPIAIESADDAAFSTNLADHGDLPARPFRSYLTFDGPGNPQRFWRYSITGTPVDEYIPGIGQPIMGERETLLQKPSWGIAQIREMPKAGSPDLPTSRAEAPRYRFDMQWESPEDRFQQVVDELLGACHYGDEPVMIVADTDDGLFVYGRGASMAAIAPEWRFVDLLEYGLTVRDDPYAIRTAP